MASASSPASSPRSSASARSGAADRAASYAKRFAAKEACAKALGTGMRRGVFWRDMGVVNAALRPARRMALTGGAAERLAEITPARHAAHSTSASPTTTPTPRRSWSSRRCRRRRRQRGASPCRRRIERLASARAVSLIRKTRTPMTADAKRARAATPRAGRSHETVEIVKTIVYALLIALVCRSCVFQPYTIPSASEEPNLYQGDYIIVSKWSLRLQPPLDPVQPAALHGPHPLQPAQARRHHRLQAAARRQHRLHQAPGRPARRPIQVRAANSTSTARRCRAVPMADATGDLPDGNRRAGAPVRRDQSRRAPAT